MTVLAIDPGPTESAYVLYDGATVTGRKVPNPALLATIHDTLETSICVCERIRSFGMPAGAELFETCEWSGRFQEAWVGNGLRREWHWITRQQVKLHLCGSPRAKDPNIRQALLDRWGGKAATRKGGPLYGITGDVWSALSCAVTWVERLCGV